MRVLILDDDQYRLDILRDRYPEAEVVCCQKYLQAFAHVEADASQWDLIHLDHDLGEIVGDSDYYLDGWNQMRFYNGHHMALHLCGLPVDKQP